MSIGATVQPDKEGILTQIALMVIGQIMRLAAQVAELHTPVNQVAPAALVPVRKRQHIHLTAVHAVVPAVRLR